MSALLRDISSVLKVAPPPTTAGSSRAHARSRDTPPADTTRGREQPQPPKGHAPCPLQTLPHLVTEHNLFRLIEIYYPSWDDQYSKTTRRRIHSSAAVLIKEPT